MFFPCSDQCPSLDPLSPRRCGLQLCLHICQLPCLSNQTLNEKCDMLSLLQTAHNADRTCQDPAAKATATAHTSARRHRMTATQQQRWAHAPHMCCHTADVPRGWNPRALSWVICDDPMQHRRVQAVLFQGASCLLPLPLPHS